MRPPVHFTDDERYETLLALIDRRVTLTLRRDAFVRQGAESAAASTDNYLVFATAAYGKLGGCDIPSMEARFADELADRRRAQAGAA